MRRARSFGDSTVEQRISLRPVGRDRHRHRGRLARAREGCSSSPSRSTCTPTAPRSEIQFGHVYRPIHTNTSWDAARFEICAHRWVHVAEAGYGVAVANDATYGHDVTRTARAGGGTTRSGSRLLRAPLFPDPEADQGEHTFRYALVPGADVADAVASGYGSTCRCGSPARAPSSRW